MKSTTTLLVVCDDGGARFMENIGVGKGLNDLRDVNVEEVEGAAEGYADRPGRGRTIGSGASYAMERTTSEEQQRRQAFVRQLVKEVEKEISKGSYDRLAIVAAPKFLGVLRGGLTAELKQKLVFDLDKDLMKIPTQKMAQHLAEKIAF